MIAAFYGWDIDWGSVTTSAALGAVGVPGALKTGTKIYKNIQDGLKMRKRIKAGKKIRMCDGKSKTPHGRKLHKRQQNKNEVYQMYKNGAQDNALLPVSIILLNVLEVKYMKRRKKK